jgi:penicillin-binding protein 1A
MTVRIAQDLGLKKIVNFSKKLKIYDNPNELLSISLGSAETTLLKLSSAYSSFLNGGKLVTPVLIDRIQDSEGHTILNTENRKCNKCDEISHLSNEYPEIVDNFEQIFSTETAYQMTSFLEGAVQRGTGRGLKSLKLDLAGKTGTTNKNTDTWFIGFTSKLVIGVYVGFDEPQTLGKRETGARTAMPIFKEFVKTAIKKEDARPFKVSENITMMVIDPKTGKKASFGTKKTIVEVYKKDKIEQKNVSNLKINNILKNKNILRFY